MKYFFGIALFMIVLSGCTPEIGSEGWCSNMKEKDLVQRLSRKAILKVWGGPVVTIAGAIFFYYSQY